MKTTATVGLIAVLAASVPALAQGNGRGNGGVPPGQRPPAGLCRIWIDGVPPGRQPAPTDCATAAARVPANGRVIYSDGGTTRSSRVYTSNGQIVNINGQRCVQRTDRNGVLRTICADGDHDQDDRIVARAARHDEKVKHAKKNKEWKADKENRDDRWQNRRDDREDHEDRWNARRDDRRDRDERWRR